MWRVRVVLQALITLFLWGVIYQSNPNAFGYDSASMLTYIFGISLLRSVVFLGRTTDIQADITSGDLSNLLVKPIGLFRYWWSRDVADKFLNVIFALIEMTLLVGILNPPLLPPASASLMLPFAVSVVIAVFLYFFFSLSISFTTFWLSEGNGWPQRFFLLTMMEFLAGGLFPLDILPPSLQQLLFFLPTTYMVFMPMHMYLGRLESNMIVPVLLIGTTWTLVFFCISRLLLKKGIQTYGAYGK